jgi:hypothetical protein
MVTDTTDNQGSRKAKNEPEKNDHTLADDEPGSSPKAPPTAGNPGKQQQVMKEKSPEETPVIECVREKRSLPEG